MKKAFVINGLSKTAEEVTQSIKDALNWFFDNSYADINRELVTIKIENSTPDVLLDIEQHVWVEKGIEEQGGSNYKILAEAMSNYEEVFNLDCDDWIEQKELKKTFSENYSPEILNNLQWDMRLSYVYY